MHLINYLVPNKPLSIVNRVILNSSLSKCNKSGLISAIIISSVQSDPTGCTAIS